MPNANTTETAKKPKSGATDNSEEAAAKGDKPEALIDEAVWESFPASDAPTSWAGKDIAPQDREPDAKKG